MSFNNVNTLGLIGLNKKWFSATTKNISMRSSIYFTATRNIRTSDVVNVFERLLNLGKVCEEYVNIVPVMNKNYNHVFLKIEWNDTFATADFVSELIKNSSVKINHNKGYWLCRMNRHPLKMRASKFVKFASVYKETVDVKETLEVNEAVKVNENVKFEEEEDFYVITESE
jgi:transcription elongation factor Elf1